MDLFNEYLTTKICTSPTTDYTKLIELAYKTPVPKSSFEISVSKTVKFYLDCITDMQHTLNTNMNNACNFVWSIADDLNTSLLLDSFICLGHTNIENRSFSDLTTTLSNSKISVTTYPKSECSQYIHNLNTITNIESILNDLHF